jgi:putative acetyltransferase
MSSDWQFRHEDLRGPEIQALLQEHLAQLRSITPPGSTHAMTLERLREPDIQLWSLWEGGALLGCGGLKRLGSHDGEVKSMRTAALAQRRGVARAVLAHLKAYAQRQGMQRLWLETGASEYFLPARKLYESSGFVACGPFGSYGEDSNSAFMRLDLAARI